MSDRLYQLSESVFNEEILPLILEETTPLGGRPPNISHYKSFCAMLKMLPVPRTVRESMAPGIPSTRGSRCGVKMVCFGGS
jgi:hypothetical protein